MQEPWARVISPPTDGNIVTSDTERNNITARGVDKVIGRLTSTPHNVKRVLYMAFESDKVT